LYLLRPARLCGRQPESYLPRHILISGMIFVSYLSDFSLVFSSGEKLPKVAGHNESDQVKNRPFERGMPGDIVFIASRLMDTRVLCRSQKTQ
jgi:hypothetical protein